MAFPPPSRLPTKNSRPVNGARLLYYVVLLASVSLFVNVCDSRFSTKELKTNMMLAVSRCSISGV